MPFTDDDRTAIARWQEIVAIPTVSRLDEADIDPVPFAELHALLPLRYPALHAALERETVGARALLYRWAGRSDAAPTVLMAHMDVVVATDEGWSHPPFGATIVGEGESAQLVGRGTIDDKASFVGVLEAVEHHAARGFVPANDVYLAFSGDEEVLGTGTPQIVALLESRGIRPALVLDEGGIVGESIFPGAPDTAIYVGVSEKGTSTVRLTLTEPGGHSSVPPAVRATGRIARAVLEIEEAPARVALNDTTRRMIEVVGPHATGGFREAADALAAGDDAAAVAAFSSISRDANAMVHSQAMVTVIQAGTANNAVPERASALVNLRVSEGHPASDMFAWLRELVSDPDIAFELVEARDAAAVSPASGPAWELLERHVRSTYGDVQVVPYVNNGGTDSRNYTGISDHVYRFSPYRMTLEERRTLHAVDERLSLAAFVEGLAFYRSLVAEL